MAQLIGFLVAMYLCIYLPWKANERDESKKRMDMFIQAKTGLNTTYLREHPLEYHLKRHQI